MGGGKTADGPFDPRCVTGTLARAAAADVLILLDRSGSMAEDINDVSCAADCGGLSKWTLMTAAINQLVGETEATVNWGLKLAPSGASLACAVSLGVDVPPRNMNASAIATAIEGAVLGGSTPTTAAETSATDYLDALMDPNPKYVLLATDGEATCGPGQDPNGMAIADEANAIQAVAAAAGMGLPTVVLGIAASGSPADMTLDLMAVAGGFARNTATPQYYPVERASELMAAFSVESEAALASDCQFKPDDRARLADYLEVALDGVIVPKDAANGWDQDETRTLIRFHGALCAAYQSSPTHDVAMGLCFSDG